MLRVPNISMWHQKKYKGLELVVRGMQKLLCILLHYNVFIYVHQASIIYLIYGEALQYPNT